MSQWEEIGTPPVPDTVTLRLADPDHPFEFFRGKDFYGNLVFCLAGDFKLDPDTDFPKLAGVEVSYEEIDPEKSQLILKLTSAGDGDLFRALCANLAEATITLQKNDYQAAAGVVLLRLKRWQDLLKNLREKTLSKSAQIGLFGELLLLKDLFLKNLDAKDALLAWCGPGGDEQDFLIADWLIEVKTQMSSSDKRLQISSENQHDPVSGRIIVSHQTLSICSTSDANAKTLNALVQEVREYTGKSDPYAGDLLEASLIETGYTEHENYNKDHLVLVHRTYFEVDESFPRLVASDLPDGIAGVRYSIRIEACANWERNKQEVEGWLFNG